MKANKIMITQSELKDLLTYNPETGIFNWIKRNGNIAGSTNVRGYVTISISLTDLHGFMLRELILLTL